jgi:putative membrane protein
MSLIASTAPVLGDVNWDHMNGWSAGGWLLMVAFWALIFVGVFWLIRAAAGPDRESPHDASEILERRLAQGEISTEEYRERSAALAHSTPKATNP